MPYASAEARRAYQLRWVNERRSKWLSEHGPCARCGSAEDLQVDHIDPADKVSHRIWSWSQERLDEELRKCQVLCAECHLEKTTAERARPLVHGTEAGYHRCHCDACREGHRQYNASWRAKQAASWRTRRAA